MKNPYVQVAMKPALMSGVLCIVFFLSFYFVGVHLFEGVMGLDIFIPMPFCGIALYYFKKYINSGELRFWQGMIISACVVFGSLILLSCYMVIHLYFIDSAHLTNSINAKNAEMVRDMERFAALGIDKKTVEFQIEKLQKTTVGVLLSSKIMWFSSIGFFYSIILSVIFRK